MTLTLLSVISSTQGCQVLKGHSNAYPSTYIFFFNTYWYSLEYRTVFSIMVPGKCAFAESILVRKKEKFYGGSGNRY